MTHGYGAYVLRVYCYSLSHPIGLRLQHHSDQEEQAKAKWADVQNNYQRRADSSQPRRYRAGYAKQERASHEVIEARAKATQIKLDASQLTDPKR